MRPPAHAYSHHGHGPRADQTGRIHISDFRNPVCSLLPTAAGPYISAKLGSHSCKRVIGSGLAPNAEIGALTMRLLGGAISGQRIGKRPTPD